MLKKKIFYLNSINRVGINRHETIFIDKTSAQIKNVKISNVIKKISHTLWYCYQITTFFFVTNYLLGTYFSENN